jgi:hypothetical protein
MQEVEKEQRPRQAQRENTPEEKTPDDQPKVALLDKAYFDQVVNILKTLVDHDDMTCNREHGYASLKKKSRVIAFVSRKKQTIVVILGNPKESDVKTEVEVGENIDDIRTRLMSFVKKHS